MNKGEAQGLLSTMLGSDQPFRDGQWEAIDDVAQHGKRLLVVQRTGWGKSVVYFMAAKILRDRGFGPAVLISPLLGLMRNQIAAAERLGIRALSINSENQTEWGDVLQEIKADRCDVLMISPERLANADFVANLLPLLQRRLGLFVVDEAHCISDWGHDFRPDYRRIIRVLNSLPPSTPVLCTTATANDRVVSDVVAQIPGLEISRGPLIRASLKLYALRLGSQAERLAWLVKFLPELPGSGIVYCLTIADAQRVTDWLQSHGIAARPYFGAVPTQEKVEAEQLLLRNKIKVLVATVALGMGFDKPDLGFVVHFQRPGSVVGYYQQVGRAGRAVQEAYGILLSGHEDDEIQEYFIQNAFPPVEVVHQVLTALEEAPASQGMDARQIMGVCNRGMRKIEEVLKVLEVDGAVKKEKSRYFRTHLEWTPDFQRSALVTANRRAELEQIRRYVLHPRCLMEYLARALDDPAPQPCGKCMRCTGDERFAAPVEDEGIAQAAAFLRSAAIEIEPRKQWPPAMLGPLQAAWPYAVQMAKTGFPSVAIPARLKSETGRALCIENDAGWWKEVAQGKKAERFSDALVGAAVALIRQKWKPSPAPVWVTAVPSLRHPALVRDFAERLAKRLGLPFFPAIKKVKETAPQAEMENSVMQVKNMLGAYSIKAAFPPGPVLLVDDMVNSRWTMAVFALQLRQRGSGPVFPFALASAFGTAG